MRYPTEKPSTMLASGSAIYLYLLENIAIPSRLPHELWYKGEEAKIFDQHKAFKGNFPIGETFEISYGGKDMAPYTFTGKEKNAVFVRDLSNATLMKLGIPADTDPREKVWNPNFVPYDELTHTVKMSNEVPTMSLAKSISAFLCKKGDLMYTEVDIVDMLTVAIKRPDSEEMRYILHGNHVSWCASRYIETGTMEADIERQFYGQNNSDFYIKDIGTVMPAMLYTLAILGTDPVEAIQDLSYDIWGIEDVAKKLRQYMKANQKEKKKVA